MKIVNCLKCDKKLGEINSKKLTVTYEKGVKPLEPNVSMGLLVAPYICPICKTTQNEVEVI